MIVQPNNHLGDSDDPRGHTKPISLIAAMDERRTIGLNNRLPWNTRWVYEFFENNINDNAVIVGRRTYEGKSIPVPAGKTVLISNTIKSTPRGLFTAMSPGTALAVAEKLPVQEIMVVGGQQTFEAFLDRARTIRLLIIHESAIGDRYFPKIDLRIFKLVSAERLTSGTARTSVIYARKH
ncbi:dihydrofolate reductase [Rhizobium sp. R339]|uniref:dihydrofolate reductase n=1 Tax=Rhizobium sp. R339 TaxID=1764273 RepID=UPI000B52F144|nr:dihydrofolate reductase [Rhizobium sp. R339]